MIVLIRLLILCCGLITAAHFLRFGGMWETATVLALTIAALIPGGMPRPIMILLALAASWLWADQTVHLAMGRMAFGLPWMRLALILGTVSLLHLALALMLAAKPGQTLCGIFDSKARTTALTFFLVAATLTAATAKTPLTLLPGERFLPGSTPLWIALFALYASVVAGLLLGPRAAQTRSIIWSLFSVVFFTQVLLGLAGWTAFLMTGKLHLPVPALIVAGPLFRGDGLFMPILLGISLLLVGPAWCSHLCYIGAWDDRLARLAPGKPRPLPIWAGKARLALLAATVAAPVALRAMDVSWTVALALAAVFGLAGVACMALWSTRTGVMTHCTVWCPIGLINNLIGRILPWRIRIDQNCTGCGLCARACRYNALTRIDLERKKTGLTCSLCGDCLPRCPHGHLGYSFPGLSAQRSREVFVAMTAALHTVFLAVARI